MAWNVPINRAPTYARPGRPPLPPEAARRTHDDSTPVWTCSKLTGLLFDRILRIGVEVGSDPGHHGPYGRRRRASSSDAAFGRGITPPTMADPVRSSSRDHGLGRHNPRRSQDAGPIPPTTVIGSVTVTKQQWVRGGCTCCSPGSRAGPSVESSTCISGRRCSAQDVTPPRRLLGGGPKLTGAAHVGGRGPSRSS